MLSAWFSLISREILSCRDRRCGGGETEGGILDDGVGVCGTKGGIVSILVRFGLFRKIEQFTKVG